MDTGLTRVAGHRLHRLLKKDLPELAKALVQFPYIQVGRSTQGGVEYVQFLGTGVDLVVLSQDWDRILPLVAAGYFCDPIYPAVIQKALRVNLGDPSVENDPRYPLYKRSLLKLQELFPDDYPTPRL